MCDLAKKQKSIKFKLFCDRSSILQAFKISLELINTLILKSIVKTAEWKINLLESYPLNMLVRKAIKAFSSLQKISIMQINNGL